MLRILLTLAAMTAAAAPSPGPSPAAAAPDYAVDGAVGGVESAYAPWLAARLKAWPPAEVLEAARAPAREDVAIQAVETPGSRFYIGLIQHMRVAAPPASVAAVLDDFAHYRDLFPDFDDVHVVSRDRNKVLTFWEQHIPVFFVPNVKYEVIYLIGGKPDSRRVYRYQLAKESHLRKNDGMIVIEPDGPSGTRYTEYDFFDADWGPLTTFAPGGIWKNAVEGIVLSDLAIRLRSEHGDWSYKQIARESHRILDRHPVEPQIEHKIRILN